MLQQDGPISTRASLCACRYILCRAIRGGATSIGFPLEPGVVDGSTTVVIESLLPNPVGSDRKLELVTLRNDTSAGISLDGWLLQDAAGLTWQLNATHSIAPGAQLPLVRNGQKMSLNNGGDEIFLIDDTGAQRDWFEYDGSSEGVVIETDH